MIEKLMPSLLDFLLLSRHCLTIILRAKSETRKAFREVRNLFTTGILPMGHQIQLKCFLLTLVGFARIQKQERLFLFRKAQFPV